MEPNQYLLKLFNIIKDMEYVNLFPGADQLSKTEFRLLREIVIEGRQGKSIISSELARRLGITRSAVSQIVSKLEKQDIVKRTASPTDKKIAYIRFSERTMELFEKQCSCANAYMDRVVAEFGEENMKQLFDLYEGFAVALKNVCQAIKSEKSKE